MKNLTAIFNRVLIDSKHTKLIGDVDTGLKNKRTSIVGNVQDDLVAVSY